MADVRIVLVVLLVSTIQRTLAGECYALHNYNHYRWGH